MRKPLLVSAAALALMAPTMATGQGTPDRPVIASFYAKDEGRRIHLRVRYCDLRTPVPFSVRLTFRVFDSSGRRVHLKSRSFPPDSLRCDLISYRFVDTLANGVYRANVQVTNLTTGNFIRNRARPFVVQ